MEWNSNSNRILQSVIILIFIGYYTLNAQPINQFTNSVDVASPEVAAQGKYADSPVNLASGVASFSLPMTSIKSGPLNVDVNLSYHLGGIRLEEMASWVGLGWNLSAGGLISRTVLGIPDDYNLFNKGYYYSGDQLNHPIDQYNVPPTQQQVEEVHFGGGRDAEPDIFSFNFNGYSGKFSFGDDQQIYQIEDSDLKIEVIGFYNDKFAEFRITTPDGIKYTFGSTTFDSTAGALFNVEENRSPALPLTSLRHYTTWHLTKIESYDNKFSIDFNYTFEGEIVYFSKSTQIAKPAINCLTCTCAGCTSPACDMFDESEFNYGNLSSENRNTKWRLNSIQSDIETIEFIANSERTDLDNTYRLDEIHYKPNNVNFQTKYKFSYSYMDSGGTTTDDRRFRLILDEVQKYSLDESTSENPYTFTYNSGVLPERLSLERDHWGYFNGTGSANGSSNMGGIPPYPILESTYNAPYCTGERNTAEFHKKKAILNTVEFPHGGRRELDLESNKVTVVECPNGNPIVWSSIFAINSCSHPYSNNCCGVTNTTMNYTHGTNTLNKYRFKVTGINVDAPDCSNNISNGWVGVYVYDSSGANNWFSSISYS